MTIGEEMKRREQKARMQGYMSSDTSVAKVTKSGKIKGVAKGSCKVYACASNGVYKTIKVTVK